jgi:hypothetical protein
MSRSAGNVFRSVRDLVSHLKYGLFLKHHPQLGRD